MKPLLPGYNLEFGDQLSPEKASTFLEGASVQPVLLEPGDVLWRFVHKRKGPYFSDCWLEKESMKVLMETFQSLGDFSPETKARVVRNDIAVLKAWEGTTLAYRVKIEFREEVVGYKGTIAPQKAFSGEEVLPQFGRLGQKATEFRIGGMTQIMIPSFLGISTEEGERKARITYFSAV